MKFDHLGVVVADLAKGAEHFQSAFAVVRWTRAFTDPVNMVNVQFGLDAGGVCYELISPLGAGAPIERALKARNPILNHIAYLTDSLEASAAHLRSQGYIPASLPKPAIAYGGAVIQFFVSPLGFIVELIEGIRHEHEYLPSTEAPTAA